MTAFLFPDNTVLCNFAAVDRLDLLESILNGRGRWTESVAFEASRSAKIHSPLVRVPIQGWLGEPIEVTAKQDIREIERVRRRVFGGSDDRPLQHRGEAETCFVISEWPEMAGSWWLSDDQESLRYARYQGIETLETKDLMATAVARKDVTATSAFDLLRSMVEAGRHPRLPVAASELNAGESP